MDSELNTVVFYKIGIIGTNPILFSVLIKYKFLYFSETGI